MGSSMNWPCKLISVVGTRLVRFETDKMGRCGTILLIGASGETWEFDTLPIGTMFFVPKNPVHEGEPDGDYDGLGWPWYWSQDCYLSDYYRQNNSGRQPLLVILPPRTLFLVDGKCWKDGQHYGGWTVTGEAPLITIAPSINIVGSYHGFLQNGVITADCEGRTY